ncbi:MAG: hypothetical protein Kow0029_14780 [Candidatus Rifleibacteriota bacterium]
MVAYKKFLNLCYTAAKIIPDMQMDKTREDSKSSDAAKTEARDLWILLGGLMILRLFLSMFLELTPDEAYYWELSRRLDWSYYDHPPMVAYLISFFTSILGNTSFAIRLPSVFGLLAASFLIYRICVEHLKSSRNGILAVIALNFTPAGMALGFITTPDTPLAFFWVLAMYSFLKAINDSRDRWWIMTGIALGLGALSKYNMIFFVPGIAMTILAFPKYRGLVYTRRYWLMVILAALGTIPVVYWNMVHDWISFKFQFHHGLKPSNRGIVKNIGDFLGGQLGTIGITLFPILWLAVCKNAINAWKRADETRFFLAWLAFPMMAFFVYTGTQSKVEANWPQIAYISAMILAAEWIAISPTTARKYWVLGPSVFMAAIVVLQSLTLILPISPKSDISTRLHGWREMGKKIRKLDEQLEYKAVFVGQGAPFACLVSYYGNIPPERIAEIHGDKSFRFWWASQTLPLGSDIVYIDNDKYSEASAYTGYFSESASFSLPISYAGKKIRNINFTTMKNLKHKFEFK